MSTTEILEELPKLKLADLWAILQRLSELETKEEIDPSPEMTAAIETGLRSAETEPCYTVDEARNKIRHRFLHAWDMSLAREYDEAQLRRQGRSQVQLGNEGPPQT